MLDWPIIRRKENVQINVGELNIFETMYLRLDTGVMLFGFEGCDPVTLMLGRVNPFYGLQVFELLNALESIVVCDISNALNVVTQSGEDLNPYGTIFSEEAVRQASQVLQNAEEVEEIVMHCLIYGVPLHWRSIEDQINKSLLPHTPTIQKRRDLLTGAKYQTLLTYQGRLSGLVRRVANDILFQLLPIDAKVDYIHSDRLTKSAIDYAIRPFLATDRPVDETIAVTISALPLLSTREDLHNIEPREFNEALIQALRQAEFELPDDGTFMEQLRHDKEFVDDSPYHL